MFIKLLARIGFVRVLSDGKVRWPFHIPPYYSVEISPLKAWFHRCRFWGPFYVFTNPPGVIKWEKGRLLPRRWGFGIYGFEFGDRG